MDATIEPRILSKRGVQFGGDFRYVNEAYGGGYSGKTTVEYLPDDRQAGIDRWGVALNHSQLTANGFSAVINYNRVSDNDYYTDLSSQVTSTSQTQLLQQGVLSYGGRRLVDGDRQRPVFPDPAARPPESGQPALSPVAADHCQCAATRPLFPPIVLSSGSTIHGVCPSRRQHDRGAADRSAAGNFITLRDARVVCDASRGPATPPTIHCRIRRVASAPIRSAARLPIFSVDSGMTFERSSNWFGRDYTQTLEPRLFYLNIPYKNQDDIPIFDTALADFNFAQIFADNQFSGWDRINNANQLTTAAEFPPDRSVEWQRNHARDAWPALLLHRRQGDSAGNDSAQMGQVGFPGGFQWPGLAEAVCTPTLRCSTTRAIRSSSATRSAPVTCRRRARCSTRATVSTVERRRRSSRSTFPASGRSAVAGRRSVATTTRFCRTSRSRSSAGWNTMPAAGPCGPWCPPLQTSEADATTQFFVQLELTGLASRWFESPESSPAPDSGIQPVGSTPMDQGLAEW
jgi:hypothetical protein